MTQELQEKLYAKYPKIFAEKNLPMTQSCMAFGLEIGDGWFWLIDRLCASLQWRTDNPPWKDGKPMEVPQVVASQVKDKFGGLRFYTNGANSEQWTIIGFVEYLSNHVCENCGTTKDIGWTQEWITTLCRECATKSNVINHWKSDEEVEEESDD